MRLPLTLCVWCVGLGLGCTDDPTESPGPGLCDDVVCGVYGDCVVEDEQASCACDSGYEDVGLECVDVDECAADNGGCGPDYRYLCENEEGLAPTCVDKCEDVEANLSPVESPLAQPPHWGTVWFSPEIVRDEDPSAFIDLSYTGQEDRLMFDRRTSSFETFEAHLFQAVFAGDVELEMQVNPEFSVEDAESESRFYAESIGKIPAFLFQDLETVWIHAGVELYGGGNNNLLIHTGQTAEYLRDGVLEEVFIHEGAHTSMDAYHALDPDWLAAQEADGMALSAYALEHPLREDVAETLAPYLAYRFRPERLNVSLINQLERTIPNRVLYLDCLELDMEPLQ